MMDFLKDLKRSIWEMTPLQEQTTRLGVCGKCHKKTLRPIVNGNGYRWQECTSCGVCWVDDPRISNTASTRSAKG